MSMDGLKIYVAGKITGFPGYKERFAEAEKKLKELGAVVMNPAVLPDGFDYSDYMHVCYAMINVCDAVYFLNNYKDSPGACIEFNHACLKNKYLFYEEMGEQK
jgi:hypothetical protein